MATAILKAPEAGGRKTRKKSSKTASEPKSKSSHRGRKGTSAVPVPVACVRGDSSFTCEFGVGETTASGD
jgi:hypothetical protein